MYIVHIPTRTWENDLEFQLIAFKMRNIRGKCTQSSMKFQENTQRKLLLKKLFAYLRELFIGLLNTVCVRNFKTGTLR